MDLGNLSHGEIEVRSELLRRHISRVNNGHTVPSIENWKSPRWPEPDSWVMGAEFCRAIALRRRQGPACLASRLRRGFVVPHANFFSYLVAFGELAIALSLIFGCLLRISSIFRAFHNPNICFAVAVASGGATMNYDRLLVLLHTSLSARPRDARSTARFTIASAAHLFFRRSRFRLSR